MEVDLFYLRFQTQRFNEILRHFVEGKKDKNVSKNISKPFLSTWFNLGAVFTILLILPSIVILLHNIHNNALPSYYGVSAANIPSNVIKETEQKHYSRSEKLSFQVMLPGVTLPISDIGYYVIALLLCSVVHEAGHAISAIQEGELCSRTDCFIVLV